MSMNIHLIAPEDKEKWHPIWVKCFDILTKTSHNISLWTDEGVDELLQKDDIEFYNNYLNKLNPIYKFDYVRYILLRDYGGLYMDMDIELIEDFTSRLNPNLIYIAEGTRHSLLELCLIYSPPEFFIWNNLIQITKQKIKQKFNQYLESDYWVVEATGPSNLANYIYRYNISHEILSYHHFLNPDSTICFSKHHTTNVWAKTKFPFKIYNKNILK